MTHYELVGLSSGIKAQNEEWFTTDLQVYLKPKHCHFNISINNNSSIEMTFDGGSNWVDFTKSNQLDLADEIHIMLKPGDLINMRATGGSGTTVNHCEIYAEV